ncbi:MAG TPA: zinc-ribbon domain-containing protein [Thermoplasmata archaeon]|nr:zinc-ribbon domain-containing protein [Thermoplasmata archaeon]
MSAPLLCTRCGYSNQPGYQFCSNCGAPLGAPRAMPGAAPAPVYAVGPGYPSPGYYPSPVDYERTKQVDRTKTGVLLLLIGTLLSWIPFGISIIGYLMLFIGAILVILGRKAFGEPHPRNVLFSIVLFIVGCVVFLGVVIVAAISSIAGTLGPGGTVTITPSFEAASFSATLLGLIVFAIVVGIAEVLFTYALQIQTGRLLLWAAYGASIVLAILVYLIAAPVAATVVTSADYDAVVALASGYQLLNVIPVALFAAADYLAWSRINRGEIPKAAGPGVPPMPSPYAGMPPQAPPTGPAPPLNPQ